jgi:hypothetical protein
MEGEFARAVATSRTVLSQELISQIRASTARKPGVYCSSMAS